MRLQSDDERKFFEATGLQLHKLVQRHLGEPSEGQIFEWIGLVLGHEFFKVGEVTFIYTLKGWYEHLANEQKEWKLYDQLKEAEEDRISDVQQPTNPT